ncbi:MAG: hypothetical protein MJZ10_12680, partial [Fibrobacter sp.]|nr:hypothetical protein [Fibrobacter sp.]
EGRPNVLDVILNKQVNLIVNTPWARRDAVADDKCTRRMPRQKTCFLAWLSQAFGLCPCAIRKAAIKYKTPYITTLAAALDTVKGIAAAKAGKGEVKSLQEYHASIEEV